jgi:hypothetical protein
MSRIFEYTETISERPAAIWVDEVDNVFSITVRGPYKGIATISLTAEELKGLQDAITPTGADADKPSKAKKAE